MKSFYQHLIEKAPPSKKIEQWILKAKKSDWIQDFKKKYGDKWESVLYGHAWNMYEKKNKKKD